MRSSIILGALALASSVFAAPVVQRREVTDILNEVDDTLSKVGVDLDKRQIDLGSVTGLATGAADLGSVLTTITSLDASVNAISSDLEGDLDGGLVALAAEAQNTVNAVNSIVGDLNVGGNLAAFSAELNTVISEAQTLSSDVEALSSVVSATDSLATVEGLVQQMITTLTGLSDSLKH